VAASISTNSFIGHTGVIAGLSFSPDGSKAVSGAHSYQGADVDGRLWNVSDGTTIRILRGHQSGIFSATCSTQRAVIATGGGGSLREGKWVYDSAIRIWDDNGIALMKFGDDLFFTYALAFSPDGKVLLSGSGNHAPKAPSRGACCRLWDVAAGRELHRFGLYTSAVRSVSFSPDAKHIVSGSSGRSPEGDKSDEPTIRIWELKTGTELDLVSYRGWVNTVAFLPDNQLLSAGHGVIAWDLNSGQRFREFGGDEVGFVNCAAVTRDGKYVAVGTGGREDVGSPYLNCYVRLFDYATGIEVVRWEHRYPVTAVAFSPDSRHVLAGGEHGELRLWTI
jgi:WD40 repeat protein